MILTTEKNNDKTTERQKKIKNIWIKIEVEKEIERKEIVYIK